LKESIINFTDIARKPYEKRAVLSMKDLSDLWTLEKNSEGKVVFIINKMSSAVKMVEENKMKLNELMQLVESTLPYESFLYYLNLNKIDVKTIDLKKIETAEMMTKLGLMTKNELIKLKERYES
jgi:hypothetical protein